MPRVVVAPDKFKGTLSASEAAGAIAAGLERAVPNIDVVQCPIADGGDGTVAAAVAADFEYAPMEATGPTGERVRTGYARYAATAVIELAAVCGLSMLRGRALAPLTASTYGVGELIRDALGAGCSRIVLGLGGSASTDGGAGMVQALGAKLLDAGHIALPPGGKALLQLARVDLTELDPRVRAAEIIVASDVDNPLLGADGAAAIYGPQKGATSEDVALLDAALQHYAAICGMDFAAMPGAGAAGGTGYAALAILGATFRPGIDLVLEMVNFADKVIGADLVITGEGSLDEQTLRGKGPLGVAGRSRGVPVVAMAGRSSLTSDVLKSHGISAAYALTDIEPDVTRCMANTAELLQQLGAHVGSTWLGEVRSE